MSSIRDVSASRSLSLSSSLAMRLQPRGVAPVYDLNAFANADSVEKPQRYATSLNDNLVVRSRKTAVPILLLMTYSCGVRPVSFLKARMKWKVLMPATDASSSFVSLRSMLAPM